MQHENYDIAAITDTWEFQRWTLPVDPTSPKSQHTHTAVRKFTKLGRFWIRSRLSCQPWDYWRNWVSKASKLRQQQAKQDCRSQPVGLVLPLGSQSDRISPRRQEKCGDVTFNRLQGGRLVSRRPQESSTAAAAPAGQNTARWRRQPRDPPRYPPGPGVRCRRPEGRPAPLPACPRAGNPPSRPGGLRPAAPPPRAARSDLPPPRLPPAPAAGGSGCHGNGSRGVGPAATPPPPPPAREEPQDTPGSGRCRARRGLEAAAAPAPARTGANMASADKEFSEDGNFSPKGGTSKLPADASPDSRCPICLDRCDNVAYLDRCLHRFCFSCVQEWSDSKAECPLCKRPFLSIFHTIRADDAVEEYIPSPSENSSALAGERRAGSSPSPRTLSPDNGVLFDGLSDQPVRERVGEIQLMLRTLAWMRQASAEGTSLPRIPEEDMISFRRALYRSAGWIRSIQGGGRYRDVSAEFFRRNPACLHRLAPWLKRELTVQLGARGSLANVVQRVIVSNVTRYDLDSQAFADELKPLLLNRTERFLHEFIAFARCPFNLEAYDLHANYDCPAPSYAEGNHSDLPILTSPDMAYGLHRETRIDWIGGQRQRDGLQQGQVPGPALGPQQPPAWLQARGAVAGAVWKRRIWGF
ncbi:E3 ubiquitin-protein ligase Topors-like [Strix uralensis]|uniref:E3 ubiquitin-protein ligase Topors-like n=1 Tax=Strix uralensis TaxID=36305 RepID=UPI003DA7595B